jgi:coenzyme F420-reducing hydrogenase alpha subunit
MPETIRLPQAKRIEGHGQVSVRLAEDGTVADAHFAAVEFRGFEKMVVGRMVWEMPLITSRVCGICPVSHHVASVKTVDNLLGVTIPGPGAMLRDALSTAAWVQDHALHFFFLAGPDFLTDDTPASRDLLGVIEARPDLAALAIELRRSGQTVVEAVGGQTHPVTAIPGGMSKGITEAERVRLLEVVREGIQQAMQALPVARESSKRLIAAHPHLEQPTAMMAQLGHGDSFSTYDGVITVADATGAIVDRFDAAAWPEKVSERPVEWSYAKVPVLAGVGAYRVGPLARVQMTKVWPGEHSAAAAAAFVTELGAPIHHPYAYHWARMVELVAALERLEALFSEPVIAEGPWRVKAERTGGAGSAAVEAPRGTLMHHYEADMIGRVTAAELVVATTHNNAALNDTLLLAARGHVTDGVVDDDARRAMEAAVRAYDPCLSCATHEAGRPDLTVRVHAPDGTLISTEGVG